MKPTKFEQKIKQTLEESTPDILSKIKADSRFYIPDKPTPWWSSLLKQRSLQLALSSVFVLLIAVYLFTISSSPTPVVASTITLDINPSIELSLDDDDEIIDVKALNDDGLLLIDSNINFKGMALEQAVEHLIDKAHEQGFIYDTDNYVLVHVDAKNEDVKARIESRVTNTVALEAIKFGKPMNMRPAPNVDENTTEEAKQFMITPAKLRLIEEIMSYDDTLTVEELKDASIRTLFDQLKELSGEDQIPNRPSDGQRPNQNNEGINDEDPTNEEDNSTSNPPNGNNEYTPPLNPFRP